MAKKTAKCTKCGVGVKVNVCGDDGACEVEVSCSQCAIMAKFQQMKETRTALLKRVGELEDALEAECQMRKEMGERLRATKEQLTKVTIQNKKESGDYHGEGTSLTPQEKSIKGAQKRGSTYSEALVKERADKRPSEPHPESQSKCPEQTKAAGQLENVMILGDSNLARRLQTIRERLKGDRRVAVGTFPGKMLGTVMQQAKEELTRRDQGRSLVVIAGGLNNVLNGRTPEIEKRLTKGVELQ